MIAKPRQMIVAGVMSGTSADGVDVALVRIKPGAQVGLPSLKVLGHSSFKYPKAVRLDVLHAMEGMALSAGDFSRLNWRLGEVYAACIKKTCVSHNVQIDLVGMHGQTVFHEAPQATWQIGEPAVVRERVGVPVVSDFRPADLAAEGQGAPLVPMLDFCSFRSRTRNRVLVNLGGIANVTAIPAGAGIDALLAFDTGPANMVIDALMQAEFGKAFDRGGKTGAKGKVVGSVVTKALLAKYFAAAPPKSCGREQFGMEFARTLLENVQAAGGSAHDAVATATELTVGSVVEAYGQFCWPHLGQKAPLARATDVIVSGGGVRNAVLVQRLQQRFAELGVSVKTVEDFGMASQAKEAVAFALLAWLSFHGLPGNLPAATGARGPRVLGKITC